MYVEILSSCIGLFRSFADFCFWVVAEPSIVPIVVVGGDGGDVGVDVGVGGVGGGVDGGGGGGGGGGGSICVGVLLMLFSCCC